MKEYNAAFFGLFENVFLMLRKHYDETLALCLFRELMEKGLSNAYGANFLKRDTKNFVALVEERDKSVGLHVEFPVVEETKLVYQFHDDPFPGLKGEVEPNKLDDTYMRFKVKTILGDEWDYTTTKHIWTSGEYTEHVITKMP